IHHAPTPRGGGVAVFLSAAGCIALAELLAGYAARPPGVPPGGAAALPAMAFAPWDAAAAGTGWSGGAAAISAGTAACFLLGLTDDARPLGPWTKLALQIAISAAAVLWGGLALPLPPGLEALSMPAAVLWLLLIANAFNLLDNMDGLCAGVAAIAAMFLSLAAADAGAHRAALAAACACGALAGFLVHNFHPARVFLGDAGSLSAGFFLAASAAVISKDCAAAHGAGAAPGGAAGAGWHIAAAAPLFAFAIPIFDTVSVMLIRLREGRPLLKGDTSHVSHRMEASGFGRRETVLALYLAALLAGLPAILLPHGSIPAWSLLLFPAAALAAVAVAAAGRGHGRTGGKSGPGAADLTGGESGPGGAGPGAAGGKSGPAGTGPGATGGKSGTDDGGTSGLAGGMSGPVTAKPDGDAPAACS
ncbi:MAG: undecaprenyl/decaprenyl-phosphate alpha-N-acetylglucosaminyl 1-phosphate transferase, partial [Planctomycetota bacterium]|nr:undecaprenyl/decaprenyl-phosphate alpha-N-acetylglucosaminyl 1-phosphate transferase [Planctomycetota bacterium]